MRASGCFPKASTFHVARLRVDDVVAGVLDEVTFASWCADRKGVQSPADSSKVCHAWNEGAASAIAGKGVD